MAKKQAAETEAKPADTGAAEAKAGGKPGDAKAADGKSADAKSAAKPPKGEKKPKAPRVEKADKTSPAPPPGDSAPASPPAESAPKKAPAAAPGATGEKQKKKKPGVPPARGKKLRNQIKNFKQRIAKEGPTPLPKALGLLKSMKRAKFDETV